MNTLRHDVVVIGGGVIGLTIAWRLSSAGRRVALVERTHVGAGASTVAAGMLSPAQESAWGGPAAGSFVRATRAWPRFAESVAESSGTSTGFRACGILRLAWDDEGETALRRLATLQYHHGVPSLVVGGDEAMEIEPNIAVPRIGLHQPDGASVDTTRLVPALAGACHAGGVDIVEGVEVADLLVKGTACGGIVATDGSRVNASTTIVATGAWSGSHQWLTRHGVDVAVRPIKGQVVVVRSRARVVAGVVSTPGSTIVARAGGRIAIGSTFEDVGFDADPTPGATEGILASAARSVPAIAGCPVEAELVGFRPATPDETPIVSRTALDGLLVASGHHRNGILAAPIAADDVLTLL